MLLQTLEAMKGTSPNYFQMHNYKKQKWHWMVQNNNRQLPPPYTRFLKVSQLQAVQKYKF